MRPLRARVRDERGVMALEFLLVISMLIVVFLLMLQYAVKAHAQRIATAAAQEGLATASSYDGTARDGERTADHYLTSIGPGLASSHVSATRSATTATVTVTGEVDQLFPFFGVTIRVNVEGPVEHFVTVPGQASP
jgi:Flp pilus assembly protein TadG